MANANEFPITTPYGYVAGYPLHNGFHQGIDYGCPEGTPIVVNGVTIGLSGNTGYTFGPHLHLGKWLNGVVQNPLNGGFQFNSAVVTEVHPDIDPDNGRYVRIQGDGYSWVYLHMNSINVTVGQTLKGGSGIVEPADYRTNSGDVQNYFKIMLGRDANADDHKIYDNKPHKEVTYAIITSPEYKQHNSGSGPTPTPLGKGVYSVG